MTKIKIGINGFGRIGRSLTRVLLNYPQLELVMVNDLASSENLIHLLKYDSVHGRFPLPLSLEVEGGKEYVIIGDKKVRFTKHPQLEDINWSEEEVDIVIESTGKFRNSEDAQKHISIGGAKKVMLSAPARDQTKTVVMGINEELLKAEDTIVSNASCTTNSAAPLLKVIDDLCGVEHAHITTVHSYTSDQRLHDAPHKDYRRGRAASESIVPTTTGAAKALTKIFPKFEGKIGGAGIRVPVPDGSLTDFTFTTERPTSVKEINGAFLAASQGSFKNIIGYNQDPIVSCDVIGSSYSVLFDEELTSVLGKLVKVVGWYDNEMGYSYRMADLVMYWFALDKTRN